MLEASKHSIVASLGNFENRKEHELILQLPLMLILLIQKLPTL